MNIFLNAQKKLFLFIVLVLNSPNSWAQDNKIWIDPPGSITTCFVCQDNATSDCMYSEPIVLIVDKYNGIHVQQKYINAHSTETGLQYKGVLTVNTRCYANLAKLDIICHWKREDGFLVKILRHITLQYNEDPDNLITIIKNKSICYCQ